MGAKDDGKNELQIPPRATITLTCSHPFLCVNFGITNKTKKDTRGGKSSWTRFDFANHDIVATGHTNGRIRIWNLETGAFLLELISHRAAIRDLAFAPDGSLRLISASLDKTLKVGVAFNKAFPKSSRNITLILFYFIGLGSSGRWKHVQDIRRS